MNEDENIDEIRRDIEDTRQRISVEIEEIEGKLTPSHAKEVVKEAIVERKDRVKARMTERLTESVDIARERASRIGTDVVSRVRANPAPIALIGTGLGWLMWTSFRERRALRQIEIVETPFALETSYDVDVPLELGADGLPIEPIERLGGVKRRAVDKAHEVRERAAHLAHDAKERASFLTNDVKERANHLAHDARERAQTLTLRGREKARRAETFIEEAYGANPIAFGALALAAGVGIAMALPHTRPEDRALGASRQRMMDRARHLAEDAKRVAIDSVREGASAAKDTARREVETEGLINRY